MGKPSQEFRQWAASVGIPEGSHDWSIAHAAWCAAMCAAIRIVQEKDERKRRAGFGPLSALRRLIADDAWAISFQSLGQYRSALLREIDKANAERECSTKGDNNADR